MTFSDFCTYLYIFTAGIIIGTWWRGRRAVAESAQRRKTFNGIILDLADKAPKAPAAFSQPQSEAQPSPSEWQ